MLAVHEYSIAFEIVSIVEKLAEEHQKPIKKIKLVFGAFSLANREQISFWFNILIQDHKHLKKAELHFMDVPGIIQCNECSYKGPTTVSEDNNLSHALPMEFLISCPQCKAKNTTILSGMDVIVKEVLL